MQLSDSNQVVLTSGTLAGASPTAAVSGIKRNKEEEKKNPHTIEKVFFPFETISLSSSLALLIAF